MNPKTNHLIWIDLEMTGLDTTQDRIIEMATIVTDTQLNTIAEGPVLAIHQTEAILATMDSWNARQHASSGLLERVNNSRIDEVAAEDSTLAFLMEHIPPNKSPMCGNSICQDRRFLFRWMPKLERYFHYRNFDVSTMKEVAQRWKPDIMEGFRKKSKHLALDDIRDSIAELRYYLQHLIKL